LTGSTIGSTARYERPQHISKSPWRILLERNEAGHTKSHPKYKGGIGNKTRAVWELTTRSTIESTTYLQYPDFDKLEEICTSGEDGGQTRMEAREGIQG